VEWEQTVSSIIYCLASIAAYWRKSVSPKFTLLVDWLHIGAFAASVALVVVFLKKHQIWDVTPMLRAIFCLSIVILYENLPAL
jgi:hypothetical protein